MAWQDLGQVVPDIEYIDIQASNYNPNIDDTITITVTATNQSGDPIGNQAYALKKNGETLTTLTTDNNGVATYTYTCDNWGLYKFSIKSFSTSINVTGWRVVQDDGIYYLKYNDKLVFAKISYDTSVNWSTTVSHLGAEWLQDKNRGIDLRPPMPVSVTIAPNKNIILTNIDYRVGWFINSGTATGGLYAHFIYGRK